MTKQSTFAALLLLSSALISPAAIAQTAPPSPSTPSADTQDSDDSSVPDEIETSEPGVRDTDTDDSVDISAPGSDFSGEIVVRGRFIPDPVRNTANVVSVLGEDEIARTAEGDIAGSLARVTGLSVVGGRFVFVRGLGERYSLALLNGNALPSPEPLRRVVPLDLFPTSVISSVVVQKSYSANYPGEFGGGVINLTTKTAPDEPFLTVGFSAGYDSETTAKLGYTYYGSDTDFTGFDDGTRDVPNGLANAIGQNVPISVGDSFTSDDLQGFAQSLVNSNTSVIQRNFDIPPSFAADITGGTSFDMGATRIGLIATAGISNGWRTRDAIQQTSQGTVQVNGEDGLLPDQNFRSVDTENRIIVNALAGLSAEFGENKVRFVNLFIRDTLKEAQISQGVDAINVDEETLLSQSRTVWFERQLYTSQLVGEFKFGSVSLDLRGSYAKSQREAPYEREFSYAFEGGPINDFVNDLTSPGQSARIRFSTLEDEVYGGGIDVGYEFNTDIPFLLSAGYAYNRNERSATRRDFRFTPTSNIPVGVDQLRPDFLLSDVIVDFYGIELREVASQTSIPAYDALLEVHGGYGQIDVEPFDGVRVNLGVRYEDASQSVTPITLQGVGGGAATPTRLDNDYFLPAATITWNFADDMQLRVAASRTIARPQFRELAAQQFLDLDTDRTFIGNPLLDDSELFNAEARYEYYFGKGERFTIAGFYKEIDRPIENVAFLQGGGTLFTGFSNAPKAQLYGAEVELVKYLPLYGLGGTFFENRRLLLAANYTYSKSEIQVNDGDMAISPVTFTPVAASSLFDDGDRLTGQSSHIGNVQFGLESEDTLSQQTILLTYNSPRVTARGPQNQPDLIERTGVRLDVVLREAIEIAGQDMEIKFEARNILNESYTESQRLGSTEILNNAFDVGTTLSLGVAFQF